MQKSRAVLDTNLFYYLAGVEHAENLRPDWVRLLEEQHFLSLASPTVVEILTRQGVDEETRIASLKFIFSDRFDDIVQVGFLPFDIEPLREAVRGGDLDTIAALRELALERKVACEAGFLRFVLYVLTTTFLDVLLHESKSRLTSEEAADLSRHFLALMDANVEFVQEALTAGLEEGYASGDAKRLVGRVFHEILWSVAYGGLLNLHAVRVGVRLHELPSASTEVQTQVRDAVEADPVLHTLRAQANNPLALLRKKQYREAVLRFIDALSDDFSDHRTMPKPVLKFFIERLRRDLLTGSKYRKNDVIDVLLAHAVVLDDTVFVTNDSDVLEGLEVASPRSYQVSIELRRAGSA